MREWYRKRKRNGKRKMNEGWENEEEDERVEWGGREGGEEGKEKRGNKRKRVQCRGEESEE